MTTSTCDNISIRFQLLRNLLLSVVHFPFAMSKAVRVALSLEQRTAHHGVTCNIRCCFCSIFPENQWTNEVKASKTTDFLDILIKFPFCCCRVRWVGEKRNNCCPFVRKKLFQDLTLASFISGWAAWTTWWIFKGLIYPLWWMPAWNW